MMRERRHTVGMSSKKGFLKKTALKSAILTCLAYLALIIFLFPIIWLISMSLKDNLLIFKIPPAWIFQPTLDHYKDVLQSDFLGAYINSIIISTFSTILALLMGLPAAYSLARGRMRGKKSFQVWILLSRMIPPIAFVMPLYMIFWKLGLLGTYYTMIIVYQTYLLPFVIWLMSGFIQTIPTEIEEAAMIEGCNRLQILWKITIPLSLPGLLSTTIFCIIWSWNDYFYPMILANRDTRPVTVHVARFVSFESMNWGNLAAAGVLVILPICVFGWLVQKGFISGLTMNAVKD